MGPAQWAWGWILRRLDTSPAVETKVRLPNGLIFDIPPRTHFYWDLSTGLYEKEVVDLIEGFLRPGMTFVDLGANIGYHSILASRLVGPTGKVYAFEPDPYTFEYLAKNCAANQCGNVELVNAAMTDQCGMAPFFSAGWGSFVLSHGAPQLPNSLSGASSPLRVRTTTADAFFAARGWPRIDLIKMDIEGSEGVALEGMADLSSRNPELRIVIEFNPSAMRRAGMSAAGLANALVRLGVRESYVIEQGVRRISDNQLLPSGGSVFNLLLTKD